MATLCTTLAVPGPRGLAGAAGTNGTSGKNAFTVTTADFPMPVEGGDVSVTVVDSSFAVPTQVVYVQNAGWMEVQSAPDATHIVLRNIEDTATGRYADNAAPATNIPLGQKVSPAGLQGPNSTDGTNGTDGIDGINAFTVTVADFVQPAEAATVNVEVTDSTWIAGGQHLYVTGGGDYEVTALPDSTHVTLRNLENTGSGLYPGNAVPAATISAGAAVSPGGIQGPTGLTGATPTGNQVVVAITEEQGNGIGPTGMAFGAWTTKTLNTLYDPDAVATLAANQFTLPDGRYSVLGAFCADLCKIRIQLYDVTNATILLKSVNSVSAASAIVPLTGAIVLAGTPLLELQYYALDNGGGVFGEVTGIPATVEAYSSLLFTRLSFP